MRIPAMSLHHRHRFDDITPFAYFVAYCLAAAFDWWAWVRGWIK